MHLPVALWGRDFLERGAADCRFTSPVYDGEAVEVSGHDQAGGFGIEVQSQGKACATGGAYLPLERVDAPPLNGYPVAPLPAQEMRPPASEASLVKGAPLGTFVLEATAEFVRAYLGDVRETDGIYAREGLVHPGIVLRMCNYALWKNVRLGPWIHVGSSVQNFRAALIGETLSARARATGNYEKKGHRFVELDVLVLAGERAAARVRHTAIYQPRQAAQAA
jgi:hypothetical protein